MEELQGALVFPVVMQVIFGILSALVLDDGFFSRIVMAAMGGYWAHVVYIALRRRNALTETDTKLIRYGFFLWMLIVLALTISMEMFLSM